MITQDAKVCRIYPDLDDYDGVSTDDDEFGPLQISAIDCMLELWYRGYEV